MNRISFVLIGVIGILAIILLSQLIVKADEEYKLEIRCLEDSASDYCEGRRWVSLGVTNSKNTFKCGETGREVWSDGYSYKFLDEEIEFCKRYSKGEEQAP